MCNRRRATTLAIPAQKGKNSRRTVPDGFIFNSILSMYVLYMREAFIINIKVIEMITMRDKNKIQPENLQTQQSMK
jgi:hypothetical protein